MTITEGPKKVWYQRGIVRTPIIITITLSLATVFFAVASYQSYEVTQHQKSEISALKDRAKTQTEVISEFSGKLADSRSETASATELALSCRTAAGAYKAAIGALTDEEQIWAREFPNHSLDTGPTIQQIVIAKAAGCGE